jgi:hypothetical protein
MLYLYIIRSAKMFKVSVFQVSSFSVSGFRFQVSGFRFQVSGFRSSVLSPIFSLLSATGQKDKDSPGRPVKVQGLVITLDPGMN